MQRERTTFNAHYPLVAAFQCVGKPCCLLSRWNQTCSSSEFPAGLEIVFIMALTLAPDLGVEGRGEGKGGVQKSVPPVLFYPVPSCVCVCVSNMNVNQQHLVLSECPPASQRHHHQWADANYDRLCCNPNPPQQHDLNPTVSAASPTVTARRLETLTPPGLQHTSLYAPLLTQLRDNYRDNAMVNTWFGASPADDLTTVWPNLYTGCHSHC